MKINRIVPSNITDKELRSENVIYSVYVILKCVINTADKVYNSRYSTKIEKWLPPKLISKKYKFIYVINPVTGTRSIIENIIKDPEYEYGANFERIKMSNIENVEKYKVFTTVRNPLRRLVSAWKKQVLNASTIRKIGLIAQYNGIYPKMGFGKFVKKVCEGEMDSHWAPQCDILKEDGDDIIIDRYVRTENLNKDYKLFCKENNIPYSELPYIASSKNLPICGRYNKNCKYIYDLGNNVKSDLISIYREDARRFGYEIGGS